MAKNKKEMTPEERLAAALVPEEEQPYELPEGWKWVRLDGLADIIMGQSPRGFDTTDDSSYTPLIGGAADMGAKELTPHKYTKVVTKLSRKNDLVLCIRATLGRPVVSDGEYCLGRGVAGIRTIAGAVDWIRYYLIQSEPYLYEHATGSTFLQVTGKVLSDMPVPYPTVSEQQRLVARIESLFAKLDVAKEKVQAVLDAHETRKATLLHDAFAGKLTAKWRKEHGIASDSWYTDTLKDLCVKITDGTHHSPPNTNKGDYMYVTAKNIKETGIMLDNITYVSSAVHDEIYSRCDVKKGDVLYIKDGATTGIATVNTLDEPFSLLSSVAVLRPHEERLLPGYLKHLLNSSEQKSKMLNNMSGNAITRLTLSKIKATCIKVCSLSEQQEIVAVLDRLLGREEEVRQSAESVLAAIDSMKQSILARAFRGELGA